MQVFQLDRRQKESRKVSEAFLGEFGQEDEKHMFLSLHCFVQQARPPTFSI